MSRATWHPMFLMALVCSLMISPTITPSFHAHALDRPWMDRSLSADQRANLLLKQMSLKEKIALLHGGDGPYVGNVPENTRLGIPALKLEDGPGGVADGVTQVTAFPAPIGVAASWDTQLMYQYGQATASEESGKGANIQLAPTVNILRIPQWGRSFESLGEDPYLTAQLAVANIQGIQSQGVIATVKHFAANNQEHDRETVSALVDQRTLHEIYLPAFEAAVKQGHVGSVMCAYNRVNGIYACEQNALLKNILKKDWGFPGFVMSDWQATHSTVASAQNGLDLEMPGGNYYGDALESAVQEGQVSINVLNDHVRRLLRTMFATGLFDTASSGSLQQDVTTPAHSQFARTVAEDSIVLLQNQQQILPLDPTHIKSIAVIGQDGSSAATATGGGSAQVHLPYLVSPLQGIRARAGSEIKVTYTSSSRAAEIAHAADIAIVFVSDQEDEGSDRPDLSLPHGQDKLVQAVAQANPHTIVVLNTGGPVLMPWAHQVQGILEAWYPGQEDGNAIASILFGDISPAGKLPMTFPVQESDLPVNTEAQYPGNNDVADYSEGIFVGYRHYDQQQIAPLFPFGFGLSYTHFSYSNLKISGQLSHQGYVQVDIDVTNDGERDGSEVAQLYIGLPSTRAVPQPPEQLKGFQKIFLPAGQQRHLSFTLDTRSLSYWDTHQANWALAPGTYTVGAGGSSRELQVTGIFTVETP
ncbi:beta-glucosidase [Tengunoibacter tsumagoiensis]|uniref:Probable beta-glucosidase G n=1 Tax=Tengunoibacter tsumagoiensis TaxID=2014871 RepID=A0A402A4V4_9CHLR|nr:glycoside hydrolase family 3 C-terminal domain-containing protein [Tengunoibacter tsumagoiensis]GCE14089.1 glycosyl hydrolase [Tengunoibacter tsumagoiensis]